MNFENKREKYAQRLERLAAFPVWTLEQIREHLHLDFDTIQKFVDVGWLYKFNVGRCTFYSTKKGKYSNQAIVKSVMSIDADYFFTYSCYGDYMHYDNVMDDMTLYARNVKCVGWIDHEKKFYFYQVILPKPVTQKDYQKIQKLLLDIHLQNPSDFIHVLLIVHDTDTDALTAYLEEDVRLMLYRVNGFIHYQYLEIERNCFKYLRVE